MNGLQLPPVFLASLAPEIDRLSGQTNIAKELSYDEFASKYLMVVNKDAELVPFIRNRLQKHFYQARQESDSDFHLIIKPRQGGVSTDMQGEQIYLASIERVLGLTLADDDKNAAHMRDISKTFYDNLPQELGIKRSTDNSSTTSYLPTGSKIRIGPATRQKGRSGTYTFFHGSEVAFWKNAGFIIAGAMQGLVQGGSCVFESTANGKQGWVWEVVNNPGKWHVHFYAWWWVDEYQSPLNDDEFVEYTDDELKCIAAAKKNGFDLTPEQIKWRRGKQLEFRFDPNLFKQEYPESISTAFLASGGGVFDINHITFADDWPEYDPEQVYAAGADWGQDNDYSSTSINSRTARREVFLGRWRKQPWAVMRGEMLKQYLRYRVRVVIPEKNSMGSSQIESLWNSIESLANELAVIAAFKKEQWGQLAEPDNVIGLSDNGYEIRFSGSSPVPISDVMNWYIRHLVATYDILSDECIVYRPDFGVWECELKPFTMGNINKHESVTFFRTGLEDYGHALIADAAGDLELSSYESKRTSSNSYTYSAPSGGHDDTIICRMLAYIAMVSFE